MRSLVDPRYPKENVRKPPCDHHRSATRPALLWWRSSLLKPDFTCSSELSQSWKNKRILICKSTTPHLPSKKSVPSPSSPPPKKKILIFSGLNFPAAKRPRLSEWAEGYAGLRMKALQGAGRHRSLSTPELPMSVVGGLRRWSARLLKPPMEEPQEADAFLMMGFLGDVFFVSQ